MFLKYYTLYNVLTLLVTTQAGEAFNFCFDSSNMGFRLNATVIKVRNDSRWIGCIMECAKEPCCRSVNYKNKLPLADENCEMLHDVLNNTSQELLQQNASYCYIYLIDPRREYNKSCLTKHQDEKITDIDECSDDSKNTCDPNAKCTNTEGSYVCQCKSGYAGDGKTCSDVDECLDDSKNTCNLNASCTNTESSYNCLCKVGYSGDGKTCRDIDECSDDSKNTCNHENAKCTNTEGSYVCQCKVGYSSDGKTCTDINKCPDKSSNTCDPNANCTNTKISYVCQCNVGYYGDGKTCTDIDECSDDSKNTCNPNASCSNTEGSYVCQCKSGYTGDGRKTCTVHVLDSKILSPEPLEFTKKLAKWLPNTGKWSVCWRATRDGWDVKTSFHQNCDKIPTLTIVKVVVNGNNYIFGGYATKSWAGNNWYTSAPGSFLFSLRNKDNLAPFKAELKHTGSAFYRYNSYGPTFGRGHDLHIANNANTNTDSYTNFGFSYQAPSGYRYFSDKTKSLLAGSKKFTPSEVEVLYL